MARIRTLDFRALPTVSWVDYDVEEGPTMIRQRRCTRVGSGEIVIHDPTDLLSALDERRREHVHSIEAGVRAGNYESSIVTADLVEWAEQFEHATFSTVRLPRGTK